MEDNFDENNKNKKQNRKCFKKIFNIFLEKNMKNNQQKSN